MTILTAYNETVQAYNAPPNDSYQKQRMTSLIEVVKEAGHIFERLFPLGKKKVLRKVVSLLSGSGICKVSGKRLASTCGVSIRTVRAAIQMMKKTGQFEIGRLANGHAGCYIFVDKAHPNYEWLMHDVFGVTIAPHGAAHDAPLENPESVDAVSENDENAPLKGFKGFNSFKQAINHNNLLESENPIELEKRERNRLETFATPPQLAFYNMLKADPTLKDVVKAEAYTLALALGDTNRIDVPLALKKVRRLNQDTDTHLRIESSIRAVFIESYKRALRYKPVKPLVKIPAFLTYAYWKKPITETALHYDWVK